MNEYTGQELSLGGPTGLFSKALRYPSKRIQVNSLSSMGLREDSVWNETINYFLDLANSVTQEVVRQMQFANVDYVQGYATFPDGGGGGGGVGGTPELFVTKEVNGGVGQTC